MTSHVLRSTHGKLLLQELKMGKDVNVEKVLEYIKKDPLAGRLENPNVGGNAYHVLVGSGFKKEFIMKVLCTLIETSPEGLRKKNTSGYLPLHLALVQQRVIPDVITIILNAYPDAAKVPDGNGFIPLFLCVMREDSNTDICKELCKAYRDGPSTMNATRSYPLHFASKRIHPNKEILKILLRRYPQAATERNAFGLLPIHCLTALSDDVDALAMLYAAYPEAITLPDRQGRLPLHLAVLMKGKDYSNAVTKEMEELTLQIHDTTNTTTNTSNTSSSSSMSVPSKKGVSKEEIDEDGMLLPGATFEEVQELHQTTVYNYLLSQSQIARGEKSDLVIRFLVSHYPVSLLRPNNFLAIPVDTVLEKTRAIRYAKKNIVSVYGLYDDPMTARVLLLLQQYYASSDRLGGVVLGHPMTLLEHEQVMKPLPKLSFKHAKILRELNWMARKVAIWVSMVGEPIQGSVQAIQLLQYQTWMVKNTVSMSVLTLSKTADSSNSTSSSASQGSGQSNGQGSGQSGGGKKSTVKSKGTSGKGSSSNSNSSSSSSSTGNHDISTIGRDMSIQETAAAIPETMYYLLTSNDADIPRQNLLARLRRKGFLVLVRHIISYI